MDLLFQRYASPFPFVDGMIQTGRFSEFVDEFMKAKIESDRWDLYLHKVWDKTYEDFKRESEVFQNSRNLTESEVETTIKHSMNILDNFNPTQGGE